MQVEKLLAQRLEWAHYLRYASSLRRIVPCLIWGVRATLKRLKEPSIPVQYQKPLDFLTRGSIPFAETEKAPPLFGFQLNQFSIDPHVHFQLAGVSISANRFIKSIGSLENHMDPE